MPDTTMQNDATIATSSVVIETTVSKPLTAKELRKQLNSTVGPSLKEYFKDAPIMSRVAYCESTHTQYTAPGIVHRGKVNNKDVGIFQINERYHLQNSLDIGVDIYTVEGNMEYARYLYEEQGLQPWSASRPCWGKYLDLASR